MIMHDAAVEILVFRSKFKMDRGVVTALFRWVQMYPCRFYT